MIARPLPGLRRIVLLLACAAPFGWAMFWAVFHNVPGQDWVVFHTAAGLARARDWRTLADPQAFTDLLNWTHRAWLGAPLKFHPWVYPPVTLVLAAAFGWMSYPWSLAVFLGTSLAALLAALWPWRAEPRERALLIILVLVCPATAFNLGAGQLGFLVAALVTGGVFLLPAQPELAGVLLGLLCLKPQFAPLVPVALLAGRHFRAMAGAAFSAAWLIAMSLALFGTRVWTDWLHLATGANPMRGGLVDAVRIYDQSIHTCLRILGTGELSAGIGQVVALAISAICVWQAFAQPSAPWRRLVVLLCAMIFAAPHVGGYDHVLVAVAAALVLLERPSRPSTLLAAGAWLATMFNPPALIAVLGMPVLTALSALTPLLVGGLMAVTVPRTALRRVAALP